MSVFIPGQTGWVVEWQDEDGVHRKQDYIPEDLADALALEAQKMRSYHAAIGRRQSNPEAFVPKLPKCLPVIGPAPLGLPEKPKEPEVNRPERDTKPKRPYNGPRRR